jgi:group I intron endonuclease
MKGIYLITNLVNGKKYVGLSNNINRRIAEHKSPKNISKNKTPLQKAFSKYSLHNFKFEILEEVFNIDLLAEREVFWIEKIKPEYNVSDGGLGNKGHKLSEDVKQILSAMGKMQWERKTELQKKAIISQNLKGKQKGHVHLQVTKERIRNSLLGKKQSEVTVYKRALKLKKTMLGNKNGNKKVVQMGIDYSEIKTYDSAVIAGLDLGIHPSNITKVIKGKQKTAAGFRWKYLNK